MSSIGPTSPNRGNFFQQPQKKAARKSEVTRDESASADTTRAMQMQAEASQKATEIQDQVQTMEQEGQTTLDHLKNQYDKEYEDETVRGEQAVQAVKQKGYEKLRDLQRSQEAEYRRVHREGDSQLTKSREYYRTATYGEEVKGKRDLQELEGKQHELAEFERKSSNQQIDTSRREHSQQLQELNDEHNDRYAKMQTRVRSDYEKQNAMANESIEKARGEIRGRYQNVLKQYDDAVNHTRLDADQKLDRLNKGYTEKLASYESLKSDPFYKMYKLDASFSEHEDHYELTANVPENERKNISVSLKGNQLVISGYRRSEESAQLEAGHTEATNSYQTFNESFACLWPVDGRKMATVFDGDRMRVILPKKSLASEYSPYTKAPPQKVAASQPKFPDYLPEPTPEKKDPTLS